MSKKVITFGEILLRLATPEHQRFAQANHFLATFGGGEINTAISLENYGMETEFVSRLPENEIAEHCIGVLRSLHIGVKHIIRGGNRMGIYFLESGAAMRPSKVVYDRKHSAFAEIKSGMIDWQEIMKDAGWFHFSGITPALSQSAADTCMEAIQAAREYGLTISCDINNRFTLWKYGKSIREVLPPMIEFCDIVLASKEDLAYIFDIQPLDDDLTEDYNDVNIAIYASVCKQFMQRYPNVQKIATTFRESISATHNRLSAALYNGKEIFCGEQYDIPNIVDRVGAGDSFMGGLIYGLSNYNDKKAIRFAQTASFLKHSIYGDFNRVSIEEVEDLMDGKTHFQSLIHRLTNSRMTATAHC